MRPFFSIVLIVVIFTLSTSADEYHKKKKISTKDAKAGSETFSFAKEKEQTSEYWTDKGQKTLTELLNRKLNNKHAKNVILFLGDGMSFPTVAATRRYMGGEEMELSFEKFNNFGISKTYCVDAQVADSACTSTAYLSGVKTNYEVIGLNANSKSGNCTAHLDEENWTESISRWAQKSCKGTGIVTTTRITHASPAGTYAHIAHRNWENDYEMELSGCDSSKYEDIAEQLVYNVESKNFKVILGGGRGGFRNMKKQDEENRFGFRLDDRDLIEEWKTERSKMGKSSYVFDRNGLRNLDYGSTEYLLGLFETDHMRYNLDAINENLKYEKPTLTEMTVAAIKMLQKEENGYFLFIEGGNIDQAHHKNFAKFSLDETKEFSDAIEAARMMTDESDTLIVVTADHSHAFSYNGYPERGSDVFGAPEVSDEDFMPYMTLSYANGPGYETTYKSDGSRIDPSNYDFTNPKLAYSATVPRDKETHGGDDVGVWASGPMAHLFRGHYEQNSIPLIMAYILKVGPYAESETCASSAITPIILLIAAMILLHKIIK